MMKWILVTLFLFSCSGPQKQSTVDSKSAIKEQVGKKDVKTSIDSPPPVEVTIMPGEVRSFIYLLPENFLTGKLFCQENETPYNIIEKKLRVFISESYFSKFKPYQCIWKSDGRQIVVAKVKVAEKEFPKEKLTVDRKRVWLNKKDQRRANKERKFKNKVYTSGSNYPLFDEPFELPIDTVETSIYGTQRIYNKKKKGQHLGTDFRAAVGTPIRAANSGKVLAARDWFYTGNTIIIDHGVDIFTIYAHMSELMVNEGDRVLKGQVIGLAGATGRVTGPHLHWGVRVNKMAIEGHSLVSSSKNYVDK
jgi:murein DD-endopeptidase MepM/ murein hydrolase activator NlpD